MDLQTPKVFSLEIEKIAKEKDITHMDAVLLYCKDNEIEPEKVSSLITKGLKEKIEANARDLNFLPKLQGYQYEIYSMAFNYNIISCNYVNYFCCDKCFTFKNNKNRSRGNGL